MDPPSELTLRERDVFSLIATGMSNAEIVAEVFVAAAPFKTHITRVQQNLGLRDRVQAVIIAYEDEFRWHCQRLNAGQMSEPRRPRLTSPLTRVSRSEPPRANRLSAANL